MLRHLYIKNFAIIDELELDLHDGMTALTGETGAGKSILLGALGLVLGDRADSDSVKQGCDFAEIVAEFGIDALEGVSSWLVENELNADDECILRRRVSKDGRSRAYINGTPITLQKIRELAEMLIDIHGQHEHQSLMKADVQRQLLDDFAGHLPLLENVSNTFVELKLIEDQLEHLRENSKQQNERLDLLRFQTRELDALSVEPGEFETLDSQHKVMANAERIAETVQAAIQSLSEAEDSNTQSALSRIISSLGPFEDIDERLRSVSSMLQEALIQVDESTSQLQAYMDDLDLDPAQLEKAERRMQDILDIARKHHVEPGSLPELHQQLQQELDDIDHIDERLDELENTFKQLEQKYQAACDKLSSSRNKAAKKLDSAITGSMQTLGMSGGRFAVSIQASDRRSAHGSDQIEFTVTANAGQSCKPLARVASGGELARISLAIQMIIASNSRIPTLIFDEVDSGVGGGIAEIVGSHLRTLGEQRIHGEKDADLACQVICITHLAQVASQAHQHLRVEKQTAGKQTHSTVITLDSEQRRQEIARMLSGVEITEQSLAHADEMIQRAGDA